MDPPEVTIDTTATSQDETRAPSADDPDDAARRVESAFLHLRQLLEEKRIRDDRVFQPGSGGRAGRHRKRAKRPGGGATS